MARDAVMGSLEFSPDKRHSVQMDEFERVEDDLHFEVRVRVHGFTAHTATTATIEAVRSWASALQNLQDTLAGEAVLEADSLTLHLVGDSRGHLACSGQVQSTSCAPWGDALLRFTMPGVDQSFLPPALAVLDRVLSLQPCAEEE